MRLLAGAGIVVFILLIVIAVEVNTSDASTRSAAEYRAIYRAQIRAEGARTSLQELTKAAHVAGTTMDLSTAEYVAAQWRAAGLPDVRLQPFKVLLTYPNKDQSKVRVLAPAFAAGELTMREAEVAADPMSSREHFGPFHGYAPSGTAAAQVVYANYGREGDFAALKAAGISCKNKIVLVRYGRIFRGNKVNFAQQAGAVGVLIYSDPADDGFKRGPEYPKGPFRPKTGVQRGSVFLGEGDPLTPSYPATEDALRLTVGEAVDPSKAGGANWALPLIPSLPIGWGSAQPILENLGGKAVADLGADWQGGLSFPYKTGPGPARVEMTASNSFNVTTIWNVVSRIEGRVEPDRWVVMGNHRDAWVAGAVDPNSGTASMIEVARGLGELLRQGWRPRRSMLLASWDAEEYGLVGSTEFVERHVQSLTHKAVAYLNVDISCEGVGRFHAAASPALAAVAYDVAKEVPQPPCPVIPQRAANGVDVVKGADGKPVDLKLCDASKYKAGDTVYDFWLRSTQAAPASDGGGASVADPIVRVLGSGSDYAPFVGHVGVSSLDMRFGADGEGYYAVYHSVYDSFHWMDTFGDPGFHHHAAAAAMWGGIALRLADDELVPIEFDRYASLLERFVAGLGDSLKAAGGTEGTPLGGIMAGSKDAQGLSVSDPTPAGANDDDGAAVNWDVKQFMEVASFPQTLDMARLRASVAAFKTAAAAFTAERAALVKAIDAGTASDLDVRRFNDRAMQVERAFVLPEGLPDRAWYKHVVFSPSEADYYGSTSFPAISDQLHVRNWRAAQRELDVTCHLIQRAVDALSPDPSFGGPDTLGPERQASSGREL